MTHKNVDACSRFLGELFPELPGQNKILIWQLASKTSRWFGNYNDAAKFADFKKDVYVGCAVAPKGFGESSRCPANETSGIPGVWIDVDYKHSVHKKGNLPSTIDAAKNLVLSNGAKPTVVLSTGHGIQAWWLFKEILWFDDNEDRQRAANLVMQWQGIYRTAAAKKKWDVDSTHDLARVFRIPGTYNGKGSKEKLVAMDDDSTFFDIRYNPEDLEAYLPNEQMSIGEKKKKKEKQTEEIKSPNKKETVQTTIGGVAFTLDLPEITVDPARGFDMRKYTALCGVDDRVEQTFNRKRKDLDDKSPSSYDMSLASMTAAADWTAQEITNLLVACRVKHDPNDKKLKRVNYFQRTVARALATVKRDEADRTIADLVDFGETDGVEAGDIEGKRKKYLESIALKLGIVITRVVKFTTDPPQFRLECGGPHIHLGTVERLIEQRPFRNAIAAATGFLFEKQPRAKWEKLAQALLDSCVEIDAGMEGTEGGSTLLWLSQYFGEGEVAEEADKKDAAQSRLPFKHTIKGGSMVCFFLSEFSRWLRASLAERVSSQQLGVKLRSFGAEPKSVRIDGKVVWVWVFGIEKLDLF